MSSPGIFAMEEVAIIGMAGRFPGANSVDELWRNLRDGVESVVSFTDEDLLAAGVDPALLADPNYVKAGTVLEGADLFDAAFFGFNPREAEITDPQHRLFLECSHQALELAGRPAGLSRSDRRVCRLNHEHLPSEQSVQESPGDAKCQPIAGGHRPR